MALERQFVFWIAALAVLVAVLWLLSDVLLPNQNGFEIANQIHARSPHIPIVFMSGYYDQAVAEAAHLDISSTILQKPFAMADLLEHLRAAYAATRPVEP